MTHILLEPAQQGLLDAAIALGDWMQDLPKLTESDIAAIRAVQQKLRGLPELSDGTLAMYGFSIESGDEQSGLVRGWDVSLEYMANDPEQQGGLELFSSWLPIPESSESAVLAEKKAKELYLHWPVGDICCRTDAVKSEAWIEQLHQPEALLNSGDRLRIEIVFQDYYSAVDFAPT